MRKMNKHFGVYPMGESDIPAVANLYNKLAHNQMSRNEYYEKDVNVLLRIDSSKYFKDAFGNPDCSIFVAKYNDKIIGFSEMWFYGKDFYFNIEDYAYILHVFVDTNIKTDVNPLSTPCKLCRACEKKAIDKGYRYISGDIFEFNKQAQAFAKFLKYNPYRTRYVKRLDKH